MWAPVQVPKFDARIQARRTVSDAMGSRADTARDVLCTILSGAETRVDAVHSVEHAASMQ